MFYKMTLLTLPQGLGCDKKRVSEHGFQTSKCDTHRTECELNHALECQTLSVSKSNAKRVFFGRKL